MDEKVENPDDSPVVSVENQVQNGLAEIIEMTMEPNSNLDSLRTLESTWQKVLAKFLAVEFSMVPIAIFLIYLFDLPNSGDLAAQLLGQDSWIASTVYGMLSTVPLLALFVLSELCGPYWKPFRNLRELVMTKLMPVIRGIPMWGLLLISVGAGFGEEWLFRGFIQQLMKSWLGTGVVCWPAVLIVALLFGACHALSKTYFVVTFLIGIYFGYLVELTGSVLPAAFSHASYDFVALVYLTNLDRKLQWQEVEKVLEDGDPVNLETEILG